MAKTKKKERLAKAALQPKTLVINLGETPSNSPGPYVADGVRWAGIAREHATKYGRADANSMIANFKRLGFNAFSEPA